MSVAYLSCNTYWSKSVLSFFMEPCCSSTLLSEADGSPALSEASDVSAKAGSAADGGCSAAGDLSHAHMHGN